MTLENIVSWLKTIDSDLTGCIAAGGIDGNKDKFVGVYNDNRFAANSRICIGGTENTKYQYKRVTLLIHWTKSETQAEGKAQSLFDQLYGMCGFLLGTTYVVSVNPGNGPVSAGKDAYGICEYAINMEFCYERI